MTEIIKKLFVHSVNKLRLNDALLKFKSKDFKPVVLCYHQISKKKLQTHIRFLKKNFHIVPLPQLLETVPHKSLVKENPVIAICMDDCYEKDFFNCLDVCGQEDIHCTYFLPVQYAIENKGFWANRLKHLFLQLHAEFRLDRNETIVFKSESDKNQKASKIIASATWDDRQTDVLENWVTHLYELNELPECEVDKVVSIDEIVKVSAQANVSIQSHTISHPKLNLCNKKEIDFEFKESKKVLQSLTNKEVHILCYPYGAAHHIGNSNEYLNPLYKFGVTLQNGNISQKNTSLIPRVGIYEKDNVQSVYTKIMLQQLKN